MLEELVSAKVVDVEWIPLTTFVFAKYFEWNYLTNNRDVLDVVIICQRFDEPIAEARFPDAGLAPLLFISGNADHRHVEGSW